MRTADDLVQAAVNLCLEDGLAPIVASEKVYDDSDLEVVKELAVVGLRYRVQKRLNELRRKRGPREDEDAGEVRSGRFQHRTQGYESAQYLWLSKSYMTVDNGIAPLLEHTAKDWDFNTERTEATVASAVAHHNFFTKGQAAMAAHPKAKKTADLPKLILQALEVEAERALARRTVVA